MKLSDKNLVAVIWDDAHGAATGEYSESEIERDFHKPMRFTTFGLLIRQDEGGITIASEQIEADFRGLSFIPKGMIVEVVELGPPKRKKAPRAPRPAPEPLPVG